MAVNHGGEQARSAGGELADMRVHTWLWLSLKSAGSHLSDDSYMSTNMVDLIDGTISLEKLSRVQIALDQSRSLLPEECFNWIAGDERQIQWLLSYFRNHPGFGISSIPPRLFGRNLLIASIDLWAIDLNQKSFAISAAKQAWNRNKQADSMFDWLKGKDEALRCELAWDWLKQRNEFLMFGLPPIFSYENLLMVFDRITTIQAEKKVAVDAIKKRWSQQRYREKLVGKKQVNLILSDKSILGLDKLAAKYDLSRTKVLEILIQLEMEKGAYIPEKMRMLNFD